MNLYKSESIEGLNPGQYIATLIKVAKSDGIHQAEQSLLERMASNLGVNLQTLPNPPEDLSKLPWAARAMLYRDAVMLSIADGIVSNREELHLKALAEKLAIPADFSKRIAEWVKAYDQLAGEFQRILDAR